MRVSLNTIKQYTDIDISIGELKEKINSQLGTIEETIDLTDKYKDAVVVRVVRAEKHPNADKLNVCYVDDNGAVEDVERDNDGLVQVVCGAPNVRDDMFAIWLPPRSVVPATYDDEAPFVLGARELRGILSQGMLAAGDELGINNDHDGIVEITDVDAKNDIVAGGRFASLFGLDDYVVDIENKMFTHRPDLFGHIGVAREIAGVQQRMFKSPNWYASSSVHTPDLAESTLPLAVFNEAGDNVPRFMTLVMENVTIGPSPLWLQCALVAMGGKPINNVVDLTNYIMLLTAQPTHAYDYDKIRGASIGARMAHAGETVRLLNDKTYELHESDIVIADAEGPIGLAGIMGGGDSEVSNDTKNIVLEVANFDMYTLRKSSMRHGVFTDALTRFNKGQSPLQNDIVLRKLASMVEEVTGATPASEISDLKNFEDQHDSKFEGKWTPLTVSVDFINQRLGTTLSGSEMIELLSNVEFHSHDMGSLGEICVTAPCWRTDIQIAEDIVEEIGRLYGFDKLPRVLPVRPIQPARKNDLRVKANSVRDTLSNVGASEVLTYSFVHANVLTRAGQDSRHSYRLSNALSPDLQLYRLSLTPSLVDKVHMNLKAGHDRFALFEINKVHFKGEMDEHEPTVPNEDTHIALVLAYADKTAPSGSPYYLAKRYAEKVIDTDVFDLLSLSTFDIETDEWGKQLVAPYEPLRSGVVVKDGQIWGVVGEFKREVKKAFKLPEYSAGFELHSDIATTRRAAYKPLSRFPGTTRDISFKVKHDITFGSIMKLISTSDDETGISVEPVGIYQQDGLDTKNVTVRFTLVSHERTLSANEANDIVTRCIEPVVRKTGAEVV